MPRRDLLVGAWMVAAAAACPAGGAHAAADTLTLEQVTPRIGPPAALTPRSAWSMTIRKALSLVGSHPHTGAHLMLQGTGCDRYLREINLWRCEYL